MEWMEREDVGKRKFEELEGVRRDEWERVRRGEYGRD